MPNHCWQFAILVIIGLYCTVLMGVVWHMCAATHDMNTLSVQEKPKKLDLNVLAQRDITLVELATVFHR